MFLCYSLSLYVFLMEPGNLKSLIWVGNWWIPVQFWDRTIWNRLFDNVECSSIYIYTYIYMYNILYDIYKGFWQICTEFTIWTTMTSIIEYINSPKDTWCIFGGFLKHSLFWRSHFCVVSQVDLVPQGHLWLSIEDVAHEPWQIAVLGLHRMRCFCFGGGGGGLFFFLDLLVLWTSVWENHAKK